MDNLINVFSKNNRAHDKMGRSCMILEREVVLARASKQNMNSNDYTTLLKIGNVQLDRKQLKNHQKKTYSIAVVDDDFKAGSGRMSGKKRANDIKERLMDMNDKLNRKLGIPDIGTSALQVDSFAE